MCLLTTVSSSKQVTADRWGGSMDLFESSWCDQTLCCVRHEWLLDVLGLLILLSCWWFCCVVWLYPVHIIHEITFQKMLHNAYPPFRGTPREHQMLDGGDKVVSEVPLQSPPPSFLFTDTSQTGWVALLEELTLEVKWSSHEASVHVNIIEISAVLLSLLVF